MSEINTVNGRISAQDVKRILIHEHLLINMTHEAIPPAAEAALSLYHGDVKPENIEALRKNPYIIRENLVLDDVDTAIAELAAAEHAGVNVLVDLTTVGLGRDVLRLRQISDASKVHIVAGCGFFVHDSLPETYLSWSVEKIAAWMISDIEKGIDDTDIKAGIIGEIGTSEKIYPIEEKSLYAAARAYAATGLPVMVHIYPWSEAGLQAAQLLLSEGVPPEKICICHVDVSFNESFMLRLLDLGVYIEFDNFGKEFDFEKQEGAFAGGPFEKDYQRVQMLARLCNEGYTSRILLANDVCTKSLLRAFDGNGYVHLFNNIIPMMRDAQIEDAVIQTLLHENPMRFLFGGMFGGITGITPSHK